MSYTASRRGDARRKKTAPPGAEIFSSGYAKEATLYELYSEPTRRRQAEKDRAGVIRRGRSTLYTSKAASRPLSTCRRGRGRCGRAFWRV